MAGSNFKVKNGITITGASQNTLLTSDGSGNLLVGGNGTLATTAQTFYIGTQAIAINAASGTITSLPGVTSVNGSTIPSSATWYTAPTIGSTSITSGTTISNLAGVTINSTTIPSSTTLATMGKSIAMAIVFGG
jgi:hypothetical protein